MRHDPVSIAELVHMFFCFGTPVVLISTWSHPSTVADKLCSAEKGR